LANIGGIHWYLAIFANITVFLEPGDSFPWCFGQFSHVLAHFCMQILLKTEFKAMKYKPCSACTCDIPNNEIANKSNSGAGVGLVLSLLHPYP
jgi:hypothetical protein